MGLPQHGTVLACPHQKEVCHNQHVASGLEGFRIPGIVEDEVQGIQDDVNRDVLNSCLWGILLVLALEAEVDFVVRH